MKKSTKAVLLSGLVCPGIGHLTLKLWVRGWALVVTALAALTAILTVSVQRALIVADQILIGEIPMDSTAVAEAIASTSNSADNSLMTIALILFGLCWLIGIVDSYRQAVAQERHDNHLP